MDLGLVEDSRDTIREALNKGTEACDLIITSGGASAGDEDHISAILKAEGQLTVGVLRLSVPTRLGVWNELLSSVCQEIPWQLGYAPWFLVDLRWKFLRVGLERATWYEVVSDFTKETSRSVRISPCQTKPAWSREVFPLRDQANFEC